MSSCIWLKEAIQHHIMESGLQVSFEDQGAILCWVETPQLLMLQLQACRKANNIASTSNTRKGTGPSSKCLLYSSLAAVRSHLSTRITLPQLS
jgi:hypothetical protein